MRMVVDTNFLERTELRDYLAASKENFAILPDYVAMEAYKADTLNSIGRRMRVVCEFPAQIIALRGTRDACALTGSAAEFAERVIDLEQTAEFSKFCGALALAQSGNQHLQQQLLHHGREARAQLERMLAGSDALAEGIAAIAASFKSSEVKVLRRRNEPYPDTLLEKIALRVMELAATLMRDHPAVTHFPPASEAPDRFLFRVALCGISLALRWISVGGAHLAKAEKLRNDQVDLSLAAFATYFDGLLTDDKRLASIYAESKVWLESIFSRRVGETGLAP